MKIKVANINEDKELKNYSILNETYDKRMASIQTVIIINTTFSAAILVVLGAQLQLFAPLSESKELSQCIAGAVLSFIAFIEGVCGEISICHLAHGCEMLRKVLHNKEIELNLFQLHENNDIRVSIVVTIFCVSITTLLFFACTIIGLLKLILLLNIK